jgi:hypothetical protein
MPAPDLNCLPLPAAQVSVDGHLLVQFFMQLPGLPGVVERC